MIEFRHIYKTYPGPVHALKDVSFRIEKGEFVFLTGPSGAGKTTLFRLMSAYDRATTGHLSVLGNELSILTTDKVPHFRRQIGTVYQDFKLIKTRTIFENVALPLEIRNERERYIDQRTCEVLNQVGLLHKKMDYPEQLSGGEQQRVAIARAIVHYPGLLIADEPTGNLDPHLAREILSLLDKINAQGTTVVVATHDHELVKSRQQRVINLEGGRIQ